MNIHQIKKAVDSYEARIKGEGIITGAQMEGSRTFGSLSREESLKHALYLCDNVRTFSRNKTHRDKMMRHYASLQTFLGFLDLYTLNELRHDNTSPRRT